MRRRDFIKGIAGSAVGWPLAAPAQQRDRIRHIGVMVGYAEDDPEAQTRLAAFKQGLLTLGWSEGRNLKIDVRWASGDAVRARTLASELVALQPEVIMSNTTPVTAALHDITKTIPIVFVAVSDPVGAGFVASLPRPGTNMTGFINLEQTLGGKWLELLKAIAPRMTRVAVMFNPQTAPYAEEIYLPSMETAAKKLDVKQLKSLVYREADIEQAISEFGREPGSGLIAMTDSFMTVHRKAVIELTLQNNLPLMYYVSIAPREGALISYGIDLSDLFGRSASYVDHILRGAKPAELPVQLPTKFELAVNLKTAKTLGLEVPSTLLTSATEVIE